ncbi:MAG: hypothetical protein IJ179_10580 [Oscillospiraceae bacterium]|nr:hypothetical protein [Oscillospiraceae bacterium]
MHRKRGEGVKNGKKPTLKQKKLMRCHGLDPDAWLVTKDTTETLEVVNRVSLKRIGKPKLRRLSKEI